MNLFYLHLTFFMNADFPSKTHRFNRNIHPRKAECRQARTELSECPEPTPSHVGNTTWAPIKAPSAETGSLAVV